VGDLFGLLVKEAQKKISHSAGIARSTTSGFPIEGNAAICPGRDKPFRLPNFW
jgi:hypothetical protein